MILACWHLHWPGRLPLCHELRNGLAALSLYPVQAFIIPRLQSRIVRLNRERAANTRNERQREMSIIRDALTFDATPATQQGNPRVRAIWERHLSGAETNATGLWNVLMVQAWRKRWQAHA